VKLTTIITRDDHWLIRNSNLSSHIGLVDQYWDYSLLSVRRSHQYKNWRSLLVRAN